MSRTRLLVAAALLPLLAACEQGTTSTQTGRTRVLLTDAPFPYDRIERVDMHIVRVQVSGTADTTSGSQGWTTIVEPNRTINLLELQAGKTTLLGETELSAMNVGAVRIIVNTALSSVTDTAGVAVQVRWPVQGEIGVHAYVQSSLALFTEDTPHNLVIDFDVGRSFEDLGDGSLVFIPWIRALDDAGAGAVAGVVRGAPAGTSALQPLANVAVTVLAGEPEGNPMTWYKVATGKTDAEGRYKVAFILQGQYIVRAEPLGGGNAGVGCRDAKNVLVSNGQTTALDMDLPAAPGTCARFTGPGGGPDTSGTGNPGGTPTGGPVASVAITVWPQTLAVGDSAGAYANLADAQGKALYNRGVTWQVNGLDVLEITGAYGQSLILKAKKAGTATITATSEGMQGSRTVVVQ